MPSNLEAVLYTSRAQANGIPNLSSFFPVEIFSCVFASISGLTLKVIGASIFRDIAISFNTFNSASDSTLNCRIPPIRTSLISVLLFPTPEKTISSPGTPAALARKYSPRETTSIPAPRPANNFKIATLEFALTE